MAQNKSGWGFLILIVVALLIFNSPTSNKFPRGLYSILNPPINFNGFTFIDASNDAISCNGGGSGGSVTVENSKLVVSSYTSDNPGAYRYVETGIQGADEIVVLYDGSLTAYCNKFASGSRAAFSASIVGDTGEISQSEGISISGNECRDIGSKSLTVKPSLWVFKNNFDGTWSALTYTGIGDIYDTKGVATITGTPKLRITATPSSTCYGTGASATNGASATIRIGNIGLVENTFSICKMSQFGVDTNNNGKIETSECVNSSILVLNAREAITESESEEFARREAELAAKYQGLQDQITSLQAQSKNSTALELELEQTKTILAGVKAKDSNILATIRSNEQFVSLDNGIDVTSKPTNIVSQIYYGIGTLALLIILGAIFFKKKNG